MIGRTHDEVAPCTIVRGPAHAVGVAAASPLTCCAVRFTVSEHLPQSFWGKYFWGVNQRRGEIPSKLPGVNIKWLTRFRLSFRQQTTNPAGDNG